MDVEATEWKDFLQSSPPGTVTAATEPMMRHNSFTEPGFVVSLPDFLLRCPDETCSGPRLFIGSTLVRNLHGSEQIIGILHYTGRNGRRFTKDFAVGIHLIDAKYVVVKIGEWPEPGDPTPARMIKLVGPDRDLFLQGRRCENQGLGGGAFAYCRRVVERQKNRLLDQIIKVATTTGAAKDLLAGRRTSFKLLSYFPPDTSQRSAAISAASCSDAISSRTAIKAPPACAWTASVTMNAKTIPSDHARVPNLIP